MQTARAKKIIQEDHANPTPLIDGSQPLAQEALALSEAENAAAILIALGELRTPELLLTITTDRQRLLMLRYLLKRPDDSDQTLAFLRDALAREDTYFIYDSAADVLGRLGTPKAREILEAAHAQASAPEVKGAIMNGLAQFAHKTVPTSLRQQLGSEDHYLREDALKALARIPATDATGLILGALDDAHKAVQSTAKEILSLRNDANISRELGLRLERVRAPEKPDLVQILAKRGDTAAMPALLKQLQTSRSKDLQRRILLALGALGDPRALPTLHQVVIESSNLEHQNAACLALGKIAAIESIPILADILLKRPFGDGELHDFAGNNIYKSSLDALKRIQHPDVPEQGIAILKTLHAPDVELNVSTRLELVLSLARLLGKDETHPEKSLHALEPHLQANFEDLAKQDPYVDKYESTIRRNVDRLRKKMGLPALPEEAQPDSDEAPEAEILELMKHYNTDAVIKMGTRAIPALRRLVSETDDGSPPVKPPLYVAGLLQQMDFTPETRREQLLFALTARDFDAIRFVGSEAVPHLAALFPYLQDDNLQIKVLELLSELDEPESNQLLTAIRTAVGRVMNLRWREEIAKVLARLAEQQQPHIAEHFSNWNTDDETERKVARLLLPYMAENVDTAAFREALEKEDRLGYDDAEFICDLLGRAGNTDAIPVLANFLVNGEYPACAVKALRNIGGPEAILALKPGLKLAGADNRYADVPQALHELGYEPTGNAEAIINATQQGDVDEFRRLFKANPELVAETLTALPRNRFILEIILQNNNPALIPHRVSAFLSSDYHDYRKKSDPLRQRLVDDAPKAVLQAFKQQCQPLEDDGPYANLDHERAMHIVGSMPLSEAVDFSLELIEHAALPWKQGFQRPMDDGAIKLAIDHLGKHKRRDAIAPSLKILAWRSETGLLRAIISYLWRVRAVEALDTLKETKLRDNSTSVTKGFNELIQKLEKAVG